MCLFVCFLSIANQVEETLHTHLPQNPETNFRVSFQCVCRLLLTVASVKSCLYVTFQNSACVRQSTDFFFNQLEFTFCELQFTL